MTILEEEYASLGEARTIQVMQVSGEVKWFDSAKGYGFMVPDNDMGDVLVHQSCLKRDGFHTAYEGARIVCEVVKGPRGLQAFRILDMDLSNCVRPSEKEVGTYVEVEPTSEFVTVMVKWFNRLKGYGFLTQGDGFPDIFIHMEVLRKYGLGPLIAGQVLIIRYGDGPKGKQAAEIKLPEDGGLPPSN